MRRPISIAFVWLVVVAVHQLAADETARKPFLHPLFTDHMVLQRDASDPIWGWAAPGAQVTVSMNGKSASATAGADGKWVAKLGPFAAGGPFELSVTGPETVKLSDVLVGDVWVCSGQSNMEMGIQQVKDAAKEIETANDSQIRLFTVPKNVSNKPLAVFGPVHDGKPAWQEGMAKWLVCTPKNVTVGAWGGFSAAGYFFGRELQHDLKVPVGLIHTSWGGTVAEAWTSGEALETMADFRPAVQQLRSELTPATTVQRPSRFATQQEQWYRKNDPGSAGGDVWAGPSFNDTDWKTMKLPTRWEEAGLPEYDGVVWFRKEVDIPANWAAHDLALHLGPIDDRDTTFFNGVKVGGLDAYNLPRNYPIPSRLVHAGKNTIAVRVLDTGGAGGIWGQPDDMKIEPAGQPNGSVSLAGEWRYRDSLPLGKAATPPPSPPSAGGNPNVPTVLYNAMIAPLVPFSIKGAIWYQGESNAGRAIQYRTLLPTMIRDWRNRFEVGEFPFLIVQLASFQDSKPQPADSSWAELREAQSLAAKTVGHSATASAIDIGEARDIHPKNKQEVGRRLALAARAIGYGEDVEYEGPTFKSMNVQGSRAILHFDHVGGGLEAKGGELKGFAIAGADGKFVWGEATIDGDTVIVSSPKIDHPTGVRYAWADNPVANLYNKAGLPANPFRTDTK
jgi:sialate O-acetylesterase